MLLNPFQAILQQPPGAEAPGEDLAGGQIRISTGNGEVQARQIEASGLVLVENQFGRIELEEVKAGSLQVEKGCGFRARDVIRQRMN